MMERLIPIEDLFSLLAVHKSGNYLDCQVPGFSDRIQGENLGVIFPANVNEFQIMVAGVVYNLV